MKSWLDIDENSDFSIYNFPFGVYYNENLNCNIVCSRIGDYIIDLYFLAKLNLLEDKDYEDEVFKQDTLNPFIALGKTVTQQLRKRLTEIFDIEEFEYVDIIKHNMSECLIPYRLELMRMPVAIGDYTDFYSSKEHATNVGIMFRDPANALLPNWLHIPVGYHGRSSSIVLSGTDIVRPKGQILPPDSTDTPIFSESKRMDFELEMAFVVGKNTDLGQSIPVDKAEEYIFGMCIFNDWSARDIQQWEYVPLGPFLGKNFGSSISPWIVTMETLEHFRVASPTPEKPQLAYLQVAGEKNIDINLEVSLTPENGAENIICQSNFKYMYWNMSQQLAHHTVNGCNVRIGDMCASGTISGATPDSYGSMLELAWKGTKPIQLSDGTERKFINDGDTITMKAYSEKDGIRVGFGEVIGKILPAN